MLTHAMPLIIFLFSTQALSYCKDIKFPAPRVSARTYGSRKGASGGAGSGSGSPAGANSRLAKQSSKKVLALDGAEPEAASMDSPAVNPTVKKRYFLRLFFHVYVQMLRLSVSQHLSVCLSLLCTIFDIYGCIIILMCLCVDRTR